VLFGWSALQTMAVKSALIDARHCDASGTAIAKQIASMPSQAVGRR
jgi:hypothetical protein